MKSLIKEQQESYENAKICYIGKGKFENKHVKDKKYRKVRDHCHYTGEYGGAAHSICNIFLEYTNFQDDLIEHKCLCCNKNSQHKFDEKLKERFLNTNKYFKQYNNKFILLL